MKRAYLAISYSDRSKFDSVINQLKTYFHSINVELLVFVDEYNFEPNQEKEMMETAFREIDKSDLLIAELSHKSIGAGIEIGYAFSKGKQIYYLRKKGAEYSFTAAGCSDFIIEYENEFQLIEKLEKLFS